MFGQRDCLSDQISRTLTEEAEDCINENSECESETSERDGLEALAGGTSGVRSDDDEESAAERRRIGTQQGEAIGGKVRTQSVISRDNSATR